MNRGQWSLEGRCERAQPRKHEQRLQYLHPEACFPAWQDPHLETGSAASKAPRIYESHDCNVSYLQMQFSQATLLVCDISEYIGEVSELDSWGRFAEKFGAHSVTLKAEPSRES